MNRHRSIPWLACCLVSAAALGAPITKDSGKPRLAFLALEAGPDVQPATAQAAGLQVTVALSETGKFDVITSADIKAILGYEAQAQLLGCGEASCMVDLGGALGAAWLVSGSLGKLGGQLQIVLSLIDVGRKTVSRRVSLPVKDESALRDSLREAVARLTGEVMPSIGPIDACPSPPCAKEAIAAARRWWDKNWGSILTIVGVQPDGPYEEELVDGVPARTFRTILRTRARNGERLEYSVWVRFKKVQGDWYFAQGERSRARSRPIKGDEAPVDDALIKALSAGWSEAHPGEEVVKLLSDRWVDYERSKDGKPAHWSYQIDATVQRQGGKLEVCPRANGKLVREGSGWKYQHENDGNCEEVLDAQ